MKSVFKELLGAIVNPIWDQYETATESIYETLWEPILEL